MTSTIQRAALAALLLGVSPAAIHAQVVGPAPVPAPPDFPAQGKPTLVKRADILEYRALDSYSEPAWVTEKFVDDRQAAAGRRAAAEGAAGLQDRQHARRRRASTAT